MIEVAGVWPVPEGVRPIRRRGLAGWLQWAPEVIRFALPVAMVVLVANATGDRDLTFLLIGLALVFWIARLAAAWVFRKADLRAWRRAPTSNLPNTWWFDEKGVTISDGAYVQFIRWGACTDVHEERDRLVFMLSPVHGHVLPIRFLDANTRQIDQIRELVARKVGAGRIEDGPEYAVA